MTLIVLAEISFKNCFSLVRNKLVISSFLSRSKTCIWLITFDCFHGFFTLVSSPSDLHWVNLTLYCKCERLVLLFCFSALLDKFVLCKNEFQISCHSSFKITFDINMQPVELSQSSISVLHVARSESGMFKAQVFSFSIFHHTPTGGLVQDVNTYTQKQNWI